MWLFDDLIKKSSSQAAADTAAAQASWQSSGWSTGQDPVVAIADEQPSAPIVIQKTSDGSILTEAPVAVRPDLPENPNPVTNTADDGESLIIVDGNNEADTSAVSSDPLGMIDAPVASETPVDPTIEDEPVKLGENLLNATTKDSLHEKQRSRMKEEEKIEITDEQNAMLGNLLWETPEVTSEVTVDTTTTVASEVMTAAEIEKDAQKIAEQFETPMSFIDASLKKVGGLIDHIDEVRTAKLEEAANYKAEKERNAGLEEQCYIDAEKMMKEKAHAEKMRKYLLSQQDVALDAEAEVSSVETTLTTLSVKKSVDDTTDKKGAKKLKSEEVDTFTINT